MRCFAMSWSRVGFGLLTLALVRPAFGSRLDDDLDAPHEGLRDSRVDATTTNKPQPAGKAPGSQAPAAAAAAAAAASTTKSGASTTKPGKSGASTTAKSSASQTASASPAQTAAGKEEDVTTSVEAEAAIEATTTTPPPATTSLQALPPSPYLAQAENELRYAMEVANRAQERKDAVRFEFSQLLKKSYSDKVALKEEIMQLKQEQKVVSEASPSANRTSPGGGAPNEVSSSAHDDGAGGQDNDASAHRVLQQLAKSAISDIKHTGLVEQEHAQLQQKLSAHSQSTLEVQIEMLQAALAASNKAREQAEADARRAEQTAAILNERLQMAKHAGFLMKEAGEPCSMLQNGRDCLSNKCGCDWRMRCSCQSAAVTAT
eukprot:TRINITY_DN21381_c0_g1_i1.p1 TRINITY_DN21381_c0_g1~~TRINITY_DN21381_c0_g1_i1.p1  ORF type:complete len:375 (+),score=97.61 TRINITY_DN21381_c0_g1_i1:76-1200(+)